MDWLLISDNHGGVKTEKSYPTQDAAVIGAIHEINSRFKGLLNVLGENPERLATEFSIAIDNLTSWSDSQTNFKGYAYTVKPAPSTVFHIISLGDDKPVEFDKTDLNGAKLTLIGWLFEDFLRYRNGAHGTQPTEREIEVTGIEYDSLKAAILDLEDKPTMYLELRFLSRYFKIYRVDHD